MKLHLHTTIFAVVASISGVQAQNFPARGASVTAYVSVDGMDGWSGLLPTRNPTGTDGPFATFDRARAFVQSLDKRGLERVSVQFRSGTYFLPGTETFTAADSGSPDTQIVYENYPSEAPVISGGTRVLGWSNVGGNTWTTTLPLATKYFENLYYNGVRRLRPRVTASGTPAAQAYLGTYFRIKGPVYLQSNTDPNCTLQVANKGYECFDRFHYFDTDPISAAWQNLNPDSSNPTCTVSSTSKVPTGDIELVDFERYSAAKLRIACVDTANRIVYLTGPTANEADHPGADGFIAGHRYLVENVEDYLNQPGQWFLDRSTRPWTLTYLANPGEDPNQDTVIVPQIEQVLVASNLRSVTFRGLTFAHDNYALPQKGYNGNDAIMAGVSFQNSQNIKFDFNTITQTSAVGLEFISCIDTSSASWCAIPLNPNGINAYNVIEDSAFYDLGANGIRIGMSGQASDTLNNVAQFNTVQNNVVEGYGRVYVGATGIDQGQGHDNLYTHNEIYDGYKGAIHVCFCSDQDASGLLPDRNTISFNRAYNLFQGIMNDSGSLYFGVGTPNTGLSMPPASGKDNSMLNNVVHDVSDASALDGSSDDPNCPMLTPNLPCDGYGGDGLYLDDYTGLADLENNLVYRVSGHAVSFSGPRFGPGQQSTVKNNILAFARGSMINAYDPYAFTASPPAPLFFVASNNLFYFDRSEASTPVPFYVQGGCAYAGFQTFYTQYQEWVSNLYWRTDGQFARDVDAFHVQLNPGANGLCPDNNFLLSWTFYTFSGWQQSVAEDWHSVIRNPGFKSPAYPADDYSLPNGSPGVGFVPINVCEAGVVQDPWFNSQANSSNRFPWFNGPPRAGLVSDPCRPGWPNPGINPPPVLATFPTKPFNPATDF